ncbi:MAG TPA: hypothetical protein VHM29_07570 [Acidimicrobiia bacterium]|jgi:hypothetical protein|nr:hypothetical protein [Acidimicrobiia bacterium]
MRAEIVIDPRFRGPPNSANGGYACGIVGEGIGGIATATLRRPPPLEVPLSLIGDAGQMRLMDGENLVGEAMPDTLDIVVPARPSFDVATTASRDYAGLEAHPFPMCFVCGPDRSLGDGLRIFPGRIDGSTLVAAPWAPDESLAGTGSVVDRRHVWAALDCPSYFGLAGAPMALLGRLTARIDRLPEIGERLVAIGWPIGVEGRKHYAGSALLDDDGAEVAVAAATWIEIDQLPA